MKKERGVRGSGAFTEKLKTSLTAAVFTSYRPRLKSFNRGRGAVNAAAGAVSSKIDRSATSGVLSALARLLLSLRLRVFGAFIASFGVYTAVFAVIKNFIMSNDRHVADVVFGAVIALSSLPVINSDQTLSSALLSSKIGAFIRGITGIREEAMRTEIARGRANHGFLFGLAAGAISFFTSPRAVALALLAALLVWIISASPEFGVLLTAFMIPLVSPRYITAVLGATAASFILKLIRGKRFFTVETLDVSVFSIFLVLIFASIAPFDKSSAAISLNMALCLAAYFMAKNLLHGARWVFRASSALVAGVATASAAIIFMKTSHYIGLGDLTGAVGIFGDSLFSSRVVDSDPACFNMALCAAFPIALSHFIKPPSGRGRVWSVIAMALMLFPLVEYRSVFASVAVGAASMLVLLIYSPRFIWLPLGTAAAGAVVTAFFPSIAEKVVSFLGAGYAGFADIRADAWSDASDVLRRTFLTGAGFGPAAYGSVSSAHIQGTAYAGHSYNTYLQIWIGSGVVGFVLFIVFIWLIVTAVFRSFDRLALAKGSENLIAEAPSGKVDAYAYEFSVSQRMATAGSFCAVIGLLVFGAGDYIFSDMRVFLIFFLAAGIAAAGARSSEEQVASLEDPHDEPDIS